MVVEWDVPIEMDDGVVLRANVFRPDDGQSHPVVLSYGPYGKDLAFQDGYPDAWAAMVERRPEVAAGSSNRFQSWEVCDPEKWVPDGYVCVRVDARGWGRSPGFLDPWSTREMIDLRDCIEWAGTQPWSSGKVGLLGISYYAVNQWQVASMNPPHLAAIIPWEGFSDFYRELSLSRRYRQRYEVGLVPAHRHHGAARPRRAWLRQRQHRRARRGTRDAHLRRSGGREVRLSR